METDLQLQELATILAIGYLRLLAGRAKPLPQAKLQPPIPDLSPCYKRAPEA